MNDKKKEANRIISANAAKIRARIERQMLSVIDDGKLLGVRPMTKERVKYTLQKIDEKLHVHLQDRT